MRPDHDPYGAMRPGIGLGPENRPDDEYIEAGIVDPAYVLNKRAQRIASAACFSQPTPSSLKNPSKRCKS